MVRKTAQLFSTQLTQLLSMDCGANHALAHTPGRDCDIDNTLTPTLKECGVDGTLTPILEETAMLTID